MRTLLIILTVSFTFLGYGQSLSEIANKFEQMDLPYSNSSKVANEKVSNDLSYDEVGALGYRPSSCFITPKGKLIFSDGNKALIMNIVKYNMKDDTETKYTDIWLLSKDNKKLTVETVKEGLFFLYEENGKTMFKSKNQEKAFDAESRSFK